MNEKQTYKPEDAASGVNLSGLRGVETEQSFGKNIGELEVVAGPLPEAQYEEGAADAGSLALEHTVETPASETLSPSKFRRARRLLTNSLKNRLATGLATVEAAQLSPGNLIDNVKFGVKLVTTDPYKQAESAMERMKSELPTPHVKPL